MEAVILCDYDDTASWFPYAGESDWSSEYMDGQPGREPNILTTNEVGMNNYIQETIRGGETDVIYSRRLPV